MFGIDMHHIVAGFIIFVAIVLLLAPVFRYVVVGWEHKRHDILDSLDAGARLAYFNTFRRSGDAPTPARASIAFEQIYTVAYGRRFFTIPVFLLCLIALIEVTLVVLSALDALHYIRNPFFNIPVIAMAAIAGAYLWVANDFISRARRLDFTPSDVMWGNLRLITAIPIGYSFATLAAEAVGPFIAFAISAFPLETVQSMLRKAASKRLGNEPKDEEVRDEIIKLQGITTTIVERLRNEDIITIAQLAYCDPVRVTMRSNLTFNFVVDCMNQALAWLYFEEGMARIRPLGLRGAAEIKHLYDDLTAPRSQRVRATARATLRAAAQALGKDERALMFAFTEIAEDPYTEFLDEIWT